MNRKRFGALLFVVVAIGIAVASTAGAASQSAPGVTPTTITIGGTFPFTGVAQSYRIIPLAEKAYFAWVNAHGGVHGRSIIDMATDDGYDPAQTFPAVKDLVENQHVFAIYGSLGTAPALSTWAYLNQKAVPQVLLATGDSYWGTCMASGAFKPQSYCATPKPWTIGWQPDYPSEAKLYAKYILAHKPNAKIGILYQGDNYGTNYLNAFRKVLSNNGALSDIVSQQPYAVTVGPGAITTLVSNIQGAGADTFVIFATPQPSIWALQAQHSLGFASALTFLNNVSANRLILKGAEAGGAATPDGVISSTYINSYTVNPGDSGMQLADTILSSNPAFAGLLAQLHAGNSNVIYGFASAWTFVDALKRAGLNPTRGSLMHALRSLNESAANHSANPFLYPGMKVFTDPLTTFPMQQLQLESWNASAHPASPAGPGDWNTIGGVVNSGH